MHWPGPLRFRVRALRAMFQGVFSPREFPRLVLPTARRPRDLDQRFADYVNNETKKEISRFVRTDGSIDVFGKAFFAPLGNYYEMISLLDEIVASDQYRARDLLKEDSCVIDAGANIGTFSVLAANIAPRGHVYAFEPSRGTLNVLKKNTSPYENVTCTLAGLGDAKREENILVHETTTGGNVFMDSTLAPKDVPSGEAHLEKISITTIDSFVAEHAISRIDFIKIDTEGYEAKILQGARETIKKWKPIVAMSAYHNANDKKDLPELLGSICPDYICELHRESEEDLICRVAE